MITKQLSPSRCGTSIGCPAKDLYATRGPQQGPVEPLEHPVLYKAAFLAVFFAVSSCTTGLRGRFLFGTVAEQVLVSSKYCITTRHIVVDNH